jgi:hypothetical protein
MPTAPKAKTRDAHYHVVKSTAHWAAFIAALGAVTVNTQAARERKLAERKRETTYAHGTTGGH